MGARSNAEDYFTMFGGWPLYWCSNELSVTVCSGPCPDGTPHDRLPLCGTCHGAGRVNPRREWSGSERYSGYAWVTDPCVDCRGQGALPQVPT